MGKASVNVFHTTRASCRADSRNELWDETCVSIVMPDISGCVLYAVQEEGKETKQRTRVKINERNGRLIKHDDHFNER